MGLKRNPGEKCYIFPHTRRSREVPSNIRGIQCLEYTSCDFKPASGLGDQPTQYVLTKEYWIKMAWKATPTG